MKDLSDSVRDSVTPIALILAAVRPGLRAATMLDLGSVDRFDLTIIECTVAKVLAGPIDDFFLVNRVVLHGLRELDDLDRVIFEVCPQLGALICQQVSLLWTL